ncbi:MAG: hypothetical protein N3A66_12290, partial [Planctomycetota bacterium]|nr:hypothetical protein [Planctomycetota bacterium]
GWVRVDGAALGDGRLRLSVSDTGVGIAADQLERLFTPFERLGAEAEALLQEVDRALTVVQARTDIAINAVNDFREQALARTEKLRENIKALNPDFAPSDAAPSEPSSAGAAPAAASPSSSPPASNKS